MRDIYILERFLLINIKDNNFCRASPGQKLKTTPLDFEQGLLKHLSYIFIIWH